MVKCAICEREVAKGFQKYDFKGKVTELLVCERALKFGWCKGVFVN